LKRALRSFTSRPRHPISGKRIVLRASSERELVHLQFLVDGYKREYRSNPLARDDVARQLLRLTRGSCTVERAAMAYAERELAPNTRRLVAWTLGAMGELRSRELDALDAGTMSGWIDAMTRAGLSSSSVLTAWRMVSAVARHATSLGWIASAPWGAWRPRVRGDAGRLPREAARSVAELGELLDAARALDVSRLGRGLIANVEAKIATVALLGLRHGELAGLRWSDIDEDHGVVIVARQRRGRATKQRRVHELRAAAALFVVLDEYRRELTRHALFAVDGPVFPAMRASVPGSPRAYVSGETLTRETIRLVVERAGLPHPARWSAQSLRDSFVTLEHATHADLKALAERSRHASVASLVRYLRTRSRVPTEPGFELAPRASPALLTHKK
jgi:integrase